MSDLKLERRPGFSVPQRPVINVILDGIAIAPSEEGNAFFHARTPCIDYLMAHHPYRTLFAHGHHVGMPSTSDMGNSEVGHNAIGAGRIFAQGATLVQQAIASKDLYAHAPWKDLIKTVSQGQKALHLISLLSDGNVHSHISHLESIIEQAASDGLKKIYLHVLTDGRDTPPTSSISFIERLEKKLHDVRTNTADCDCRIVSVSGRMVAFMDRYEANWDLVERGWALTVEGKGERFPSATAGIQHFHKTHLNDQFIPPFLVVTAEQKIITIEDGDAVICCNFRGDRAIELSKAFENRAPIHKNKEINVHYLGMTLYDGDTHLPRHYLVAPPRIDRTMGEYLVATNLRLFAVSETQKYGHVTYFWNGNRSKPFSTELETYFEVKSPDRPFEEIPWMKAAEITDVAIQYLHSGKYAFGRINYPNGDMVGHTGDFRAAILAVEAVDLALQRLLIAVKQMDGIAIITADHGNCDEMFPIDKQTQRAFRDPHGDPLLKTSHTLHPVPFIIYDNQNSPPHYSLKSTADLKNAGIAHITATTIELMGYTPPEAYLPSLIEWNKTS